MENCNVLDGAKRSVVEENPVSKSNVSLGMDSARSAHRKGKQKMKHNADHEEDTLLVEHPSPQGATLVDQIVSVTTVENCNELDGAERSVVEKNPVSESNVSADMDSARSANRKRKQKMKHNVDPSPQIENALPQVENALQKHLDTVRNHPEFGEEQRKKRKLQDESTQLVENQGYCIAFAWIASFHALGILNRQVMSENRFVSHGIFQRIAPDLQEKRLDSQSFSRERISDIMEELEKLMPRLSNAKRFKRVINFYKYQWNEHGSCIMPSVSDFFKLILKKNYEYAEKLRSLLEESLIVPSNNNMYKVRDIVDAIAKGLGKNVRVVYEHKVLKEIYIVTDLEYVMVDDEIFFPDYPLTL